jgi:hypothetical protein
LLLPNQGQKAKPRGHQTFGAFAFLLAAVAGEPGHAGDGLRLLNGRALLEHLQELNRVGVALSVRGPARAERGGDDDEEGGDDNGVKITVLDGDDDDVHADHLGLKKMMGGCGSNENKIFLGSGAINEKKQLITNNSNLKVLVESVKREGEIIKIKTKSGKTYEYLPHFGAELEMLRCEGYNIKIKK